MPPPTHFRQTVRAPAPRWKPWWRLTAAERRRAYHGSTFGPAYRNWIIDELSPYINSDGTCTSNGHAGVVTALRQIRTMLIEGSTDGS
jgi:hypothetical protein